MIKIIGVGLITFFCFSCHSPNSISITAEAHAEEVESWHQSRVNSLNAEDGWLNLAGLFWLEEGNNSFGSGIRNDLRVEVSEFPQEVGSFVLQEDQVIFIPKVEGINLGERQIEGEILVFDESEIDSKTMSFKNFRWNIIKRGEALGIRLRDLEAPALTDFHGIDRYPVDLNWRLEATFIPYDPIKEIPITNVLGQTIPNPSPGIVEFEIEGKAFRLDALEGGEKELFLIFADGTSGRETYGGGRYIYIPKADASGKTILDFNKAYNPPCVFTAHATCPLPPRQNILDLSITAGEKDFSH